MSGKFGAILTENEAKIGRIIAGSNDKNVTIFYACSFGREGEVDRGPKKPLGEVCACPSV